MWTRRAFISRAAALAAAGAGAAGRSADRSFLLSATVDFPDDVGFGVYTPEFLDRMMALLGGLGVRRVYWLYYGDVDPASEWAGTMIDYMKYGRATLERIGEPVRAAVPVAHRHGLELYAVLKPYNTGLSGTYPEGSPQAGSRLRAGRAARRRRHRRARAYRGPTPASAGTRSPRPHRSAPRPRAR